MRPLIPLSILFAVSNNIFARPPQDAPALPRPKGKVVRVSNVEEIYRAVSRLQSGTTILLRKGTYRLHRPIHIAPKTRLKNIAIRGATGRFQDVVVKGAGMNNKAVWHGVLASNVDGLLIADLTLGWVGYHPIALQPNNRNVHVYHCRLVDAGEQFVKASSNGKGGGADNGIVEYCVIEYSKNGPPNGYTNGVDVHGGKNWIIRHNVLRNIRTPAGAKYKAVPAVLMWNGAKHTVCEANTFVNCDRAIAFGLLRKRKAFHDHEGGIIRNNFIFVGKGAVRHVDTGIFVASPGTKVLHNTVLLNGGYPNAIEVRWITSKSADVYNNLTDARIVARDKARMTALGNVANATAAMFKAAKNGDLHLARNVRIRSVKPHPNCAVDWDGTNRSNSQVTVGADDPVKTARKR